jgi:hypothetical protein
MPSSAIPKMGWRESSSFVLFGVIVYCLKVLMAVLDMIAMSLWAKYVYRLRFYPSVRLSSCQKKKRKMVVFGHHFRATFSRSFVCFYLFDACLKKFENTRAGDGRNRREESQELQGE